ncbi:hypothetical protein PHMEG_00013295 [Phytophthora megakarya]|uniref:Transmembrane protein n=1 Tax=Phytophthora megakarya TaxID=4795 RepID=A0A225W724_9STRA|nr:hypothetical protein PHMEG_00013295 [Phytophthora megakarya]
MSYVGDDKSRSGHWATEYNIQQKVARKGHLKSIFRPSVFTAFLAIVGRIIVGPIALLLLFTATKYYSNGAVLIKADHRFFAFTENDVTMSGGCSGCMGPCKIVLLKYALFNGSAFVSSPVFNAFVALGPTEMLYDFSSLSPKALALGESLDQNGAVCQSGTNDWGATHNVVTGSAQQLLDVINTLGLSIAPQMVRELELSVGRTDGCDTRWSILGVSRLFQFPTKVGDSNFGKLSAVDLSVFPDYTECRPVVTIDDNLIRSKLALATKGENYLSAVPDSLTLFPYSFSSSLRPVARSVAAGTTKYGGKTVTQPLLRGYYSGCRVREVNTTGIFIEDTCEPSKHWEAYGLMVHSPDDIPLCSTGDVCIHNYFNSLWEWVNYIATDQPDRNGMNVNSFRTRYADTVAINVLPGLVVGQILIMGVVSLYQVMSHKRSVLLTQIWAYRCQNGRMQVVYLAQIIYHLVFYSDLYMLGLATGTLTNESISNLTCCFFAFSYSFINLVKARSGDQQLDRHFRLIWEAMQLISTISVGVILLSVQRTPIASIITKNSEILRKTSARGAKYCGLNDSCILFMINMPTVIATISIGLGFVALIASFILKKTSRMKRVRQQSVILSSVGQMSSRTASKVTAPVSAGKSNPVYETEDDNLTSFERNCLGSSFHRLFYDCDDIAYVVYNEKRCTTVEALLLTGYLYYGEHIYQASSVLLLLVARIVPSKMLRTFNVLLLRWHMDPKDGTLSQALSCTWYTASSEQHKLAAATPLA